MVTTTSTATEMTTATVTGVAVADMAIWMAPDVEHQGAVRGLAQGAAVMMRKSGSGITRSATMAVAAGAAYALLFGYVGSTFASVQYSILPLLWVLLGGAATTLGPLLGTLFMYYLIDISNDLLSAWVPDWNFSSIGVVGVALILLILFFPRGLLGTIRERWLPWLP